MFQGIKVTAYLERGVGNDPEPLGAAFLQGPPFISPLNGAYCIGTHSVSSFIYILY